MTRGKAHTFLGMKIVHRDDRHFSLGMKPFLEQTIDEFGEEPMKASTPARSDLFDVDESKPLVDEHKKKLFHRLVHRTMFCAGRGRKDFEATTSFLSKRPNFCNEDDCCKLRRMARCARDAKELEAPIGAEDIGRLIAFIDASHAVHPSMRGHAGGAIAFGIGVLESDSKMQKSNTRSSTESEIVGVSDMLPKVSCVQLFVEAQGHPLKENIIFKTTNLQ